MSFQNLDIDHSTMPGAVREAILQGLYQLRSDDSVRAERAFRHFSTKEMQEQHGKSGRTREQVLEGYRQHGAKVEQALAWVKTHA